MNEPLCPKGHGPMRQMSLMDHAVFRGSQLEEHTALARYQCQECGEHVERQASAQEQQLAVCDFCSGPGPLKWYPCASFTDQAIAYDKGVPVHVFEPWTSVGDWAACVVCQVFIDADNQPGLTRRAVEGHMARKEPDADGRKRKFLLDSMGQLHREFFAHRIRSDDKRP